MDVSPQISDDVSLGNSTVYAMEDSSAKSLKLGVLHLPLVSERGKTGADNLTCIAVLTAADLIINKLVEFFRKMNVS
jgi:hypothetical protein